MLSGAYISSRCKLLVVKGIPAFFYDTGALVSSLLALQRMGYSPCGWLTALMGDC